MMMTGLPSNAFFDCTKVQLHTKPISTKNRKKSAPLLIKSSFFAPLIAHYIIGFSRDFAFFLRKQLLVNWSIGGSQEEK